MKKKGKTIKRRHVTFFLVTLSVVLGIILLAAGVFIFLSQRMYPGVYVQGVFVGGLKRSEATQKVFDSFNMPQEIVIAYKHNENKEVVISASDIALTYDIDAAITESFKVGHGPSLRQNIAALLLSFESVDIPVKPLYNQETFTKYVATIADEITEAPVAPSIEVTAKTATILPGKPGYVVDYSHVEQTLIEALVSGQSRPTVVITPVRVDPTLSTDEINTLQARADAVVKKSLAFEFEYQLFPAANLTTYLNPYGGFDDKKIMEYLQTIAAAIDREPQDPTFLFTDGRVKEFSPAKDGVAFDIEEAQKLFTNALEDFINGTTTVGSVALTPPIASTKANTQTKDINNLGIAELIGRGTSKFRGSIPSRVHNVALAASKMNGVLIAPGETFSFNDALGDVSKFTGYKEAYVIREGKTVLGDGGGVCQVSTTLFRAALNAGLPIAERRGHSYRVGYYEQDSPPGLDSTVFAPTTDLKIVNNTPGHILIQTKTDTKALTLVFELYGTSDGRVSSVSKPTISDVSEPAEDLYVDDPTLPAGSVKQIEHKAWGSKVRFNYTVTRNGEEIYKKTFLTNYRPWQAVYLRGTKPL